jgi:hypothetical protein
MAATWVEEFKNEIAADFRALDEARRRRAGGVWSHGTALARTQAFYRERIAGFRTCGSVTAAECAQLLALIDGMGAAAPSKS